MDEVAFVLGSIAEILRGTREYMLVPVLEGKEEYGRKHWSLLRLAGTAVPGAVDIDVDIMKGSLYILLIQRIGKEGSICADWRTAWIKSDVAAARWAMEESNRLAARRAVEEGERIKEGRVDDSSVDDNDDIPF